MTAIGPLYRLYLVLGWKYFNLETSGLSSYIFTPVALDSLGIGSLISIMMSNEEGRLRVHRMMRYAVPVTGLALAVIATNLRDWGTVLLDTGTALMLGWLIYRASCGFRGIPGLLLKAAPLVFIGRISYGIYVYHALVPAALARLGPTIGVSVPDGAAIRFCLFAGLTLLVSTPCS